MSPTLLIPVINWYSDFLFTRWSGLLAFHHADIGKDFLAFLGNKISFRSQCSVEIRVCQRVPVVWVQAEHTMIMFRLLTQMEYTASSHNIFFKGVMTWAKVSSLVFRFWSLSWINGPNTQLKWKLRYSPIQYAYLKPSAMYFSDCRCTRIGLGIEN